MMLFKAKMCKYNTLMFLWVKSSSATIQMKVNEWFLTLVLFYSNNYYAAQDGSKFNICGWNPNVWLFKIKQ